MSRPLTVNEREIIELLVRHSGVAAASDLVRQLPFVRVKSGHVTALVLEAPEATPAPVPEILPVLGVVVSPGGEDVGQFALWTSGGVLSYLEFGWVTQDRPDVLPPSTWVSPVPMSS